MIRELILSLTAAAIAAAVTSCGKTQPVKAAATADVIPNITISKVSRSSIAGTYGATGTVRAKTTTQVSSNLMGRVNSIPVNEGTAVRKGQILVEIDDRDVQAQLEKAQAALRETQASVIELDNSIAGATAAIKTAEATKQIADDTFTRYKELFKRRSVSGQEYDEALSKSNAATSEVERANANARTIISKKAQVYARIEQTKADIANFKVYSSYSRIVAPVSGIVVKKFAEAGAIASQGSPLLSIEDNSLYRLEAAVEESHSGPIHIGSRVEVRIDALGPSEIIGTVAEILPTADPASRSYTVKIDLPSNPLLRTGLFGLARFPLAQKETITVPQAALIERGQLSGVYLVGLDGIVHFRIVTTGRAIEGMIEVLSGVNEGDEVASSNTEKLYEGAKVR